MPDHDHKHHGHRHDDEHGDPGDEHPDPDAVDDEVGPDVVELLADDALE